MFFQAGCLAFGLWSRERLAADSGMENVSPHGFDGIALAHNVHSESEVDEVIAAAEAADATVMRRPAKTFYGGYAGNFADPDGHAWEIAYNPGFALMQDGTLRLPDFGTT